MIYMGTGVIFAPHTPRIDALMGLKLRARGFRGTRDESLCLYGSMSKEHAREYARDEKDEYLRILSPQPGAVVSWAPGVRDLLLKFESHLRDIVWEQRYFYNGLRFESLVRDIAGDISTAETYLTLGRQKKAIGAIIDMFLDDVRIIEHIVVDYETMLAALDGHNGEVWITGPCLVSDCVSSNPVNSASM